MCNRAGAVFPFELVKQCTAAHFSGVPPPSGKVMENSTQGHESEKPMKTRTQVAVDLLEDPSMLAMMAAFIFEGEQDLEATFMEAMKTGTKFWLSKQKHETFTSFSKIFDKDSLQGYYILDKEFEVYLMMLAKKDIFGLMYVTLIKSSSKHVCFDLWYCGTSAIRHCKKAYAAWKLH